MIFESAGDMYCNTCTPQSDKSTAKPIVMIQSCFHMASDGEYLHSNSSLTQDKSGWSQKLLKVEGESIVYVWLIPTFIKTLALSVCDLQWLLSWLLHQWTERLSVTNLSLEEALPTFWLNAPVVIRAKWMTTGAFSRNVCKVFSKLINLLHYLSAVCLCSDG